MGQGAPGRHLTAAVALVGLLALTGCTAEPEPPPTTASPTTTSPTPTPTPTPTETAPAPPTKPAAMDLGDEAGAIAAAEYFMELFGYVMISGDLDAWTTECADDCIFCGRVTSDVAEVYGADGSFTGGTVSVSRVVPGPRHPTLGGFPVTVDYTIAAGAELGPDGAVVEDLPAEHGSVVLDLQHTPTGWVLVELSTEPGFSVFTE